jgi:serine/threonine protein kinase/tetratricopeptide (TPR) repeat protein
MICSSCQADNDPTAEVCFTCGKAFLALTRGSTIASRYEIVDILGRGGMGTVYKAIDRMLDETVAIKVLRRDLTGSPEAAHRFRTEIKLARRVSHTNVCRIHEYGEEGGVSFISMALLEGRDLRQHLAAHPEGLPIQEAFGICIQVARGLQAIHEAGIIHRDLKTPNIMCDDGGVVRLMDFGIAKELVESGAAGLTGTGMVIGTPEYMSPEQCRGDKVDVRSDVYSLGVVIFEVFAGRVPFIGDSMMATLFKHMQEPPPLAGPLAARIPGSAIPILRKALAKAPAERYATAGEMATALEQARSAPGGHVMPTLGLTRPEDRRRQTRLETPISVVVKRTSAGGAILQEERTIADNISRTGARVMTTMTSIAVGDVVVFEEIGGDFRTRASVRNLYAGQDRIPRLGLEFLDRTAPNRLVQTGEWTSSIPQATPRGPQAGTAAERASSAPPPGGGVPAPPTPAPQAAAAPAPPPVERRSSSRLAMPLEVVLKRTDRAGEVQEERTLAENIGLGGTQVLTAMASVSVGDILGLQEVGRDFQTAVAVRNTHSGKDGIRRLNLQFLDRSAPDRLVATGTSAPRASGSGTNPGAQRQDAAATATAGEREALRIRRQQIAEAFEGLTTRSHFDVLGIARASSEVQVREAYRNLVRRHHPDAVTDPGLADLKPQISEIFIRLGEAHDTLTDPERRTRYESLLGPSRRTPGTQMPATPTPPPEESMPPSAAPSSPRRQLEPEEAAAVAEEARAGAQRLINEGKFWDAIQRLEAAIEVVPAGSRTRHPLQLLLARAVAKNPKWTKRAEEILQKIVAEDARNAEAHFALGDLYESAGFKARAQRMFRRVLDLDPRHADAAAKLAG